MKAFRGTFLVLFLLLALNLAISTDLKASPANQVGNYPFTTVVVSPSNLRSGPSTAHAIVGSRPGGAVVQVIRCNQDCDWYQLATGEWIAAFLVDASPVALNSAELSVSIAAIVPATLPAEPITNYDANLRSGPSTNYPVVGGAKAGQKLIISARNDTGDWYQLSDGNWIAAFLVNSAPEMLPVVIVALDQVSTQVTSLAVEPVATPIPTPQVLTAVTPSLNPLSGQRSGARCRDGTYSSATGRGACSWHGGVAEWLYYP
jgi:uncharacterized protein YraI